MAPPVVKEITQVTDSISGSVVPLAMFIFIAAFPSGQNISKSLEVFLVLVSAKSLAVFLVLVSPE